MNYFTKFGKPVIESRDDPKMYNFSVSFKLLIENLQTIDIDEIVEKLEGEAWGCFSATLALEKSALKDLPDGMNLGEFYYDEMDIDDVVETLETQKESGDKEGLVWSTYISTIFLDDPTGSLDPVYAVVQNKKTTKQVVTAAEKELKKSFKKDIMLQRGVEYTIDDHTITA